MGSKTREIEPKQQPQDKGKVGRPTLYEGEITLAKAEAYIKNCTKKTRSKAVELPQLAGLAIHLGVSNQTLRDWGEKHPEFLDTLERVKQYQKVMLINNGLSNRYNSTIAKLCLAANHNMKDQKEENLNIVGQEEKPLQVLVKCKNG